MHKKTLIYAHRTGCSLYPENSFYGFKECLKKGYDFIDMDVCLCKDHHFVLSHDPYLNPQLVTKNNQPIAKEHYLIKNLTKSELGSFSVINTNQTLTFLEDIFTYGKSFGANNQIEVKFEEEKKELYFSKELLATTLISVLKAYDVISHVEVQCFDFSFLTLLHTLEPSIKTAFLTERYFENLEHLKTLGAAIWGPRADHLSPELVKKAHKLHLKVVPWTINTAAKMKRILSYEVDGIITDSPDLLKELLDEQTS